MQELAAGSTSGPADARAGRARGAQARCAARGWRRERWTTRHIIEEDPHISILVLGAASGPEGPGPLVSSLASQMAGTMRVPVTIVPGTLDNEQIDELT